MEWILTSPEYIWLVTEDGVVEALERDKGGTISQARVIDGKLDPMFRDSLGVMTAIVPEHYIKEYKKWKKEKSNGISS
jgi:hypothetical protein